MSTSAAVQRDPAVAILEVAPVGAALLDAAGRVRWVNGHLAELLGGAGTCVGRMFDDLVLTAGLPLEVVGGPIPGTAGEGYRLVRSVAAERTAGAEHARAVSLHHATLESTADGILVVDLQGRVLSYNRRFLDLWRVPDELMAGGRDEDLLQFVVGQIRDQDAFLARVAQLYASPEESSYDEIQFTDGRTLERYSQPQRIDGLAVGRVWSFRDITERKDAEEKARRSRQELRALAGRLLLVREEERTKIAREIHDELGQALTGLKFDLAWLKGRVEEPEVAEHVQSIVARIDGTIDAVRRIATALRPSVLDHLGLVAAIEWQAQEFERRTGIRTAVRVRTSGAVIDDVRGTAVFRMLQETLTNVARHARATRVDIAFTVGDVDLTLEVRDDGRGITGAEVAGNRSLGLVGLRERAIACGGTLAIEGAPGQGTRVSIRLPLPGYSLPGWTP